MTPALRAGTEREPAAPVWTGSGPAGWLARLGALVRRIIGAPDYSVYLSHVQAKHSDIEPLTEREFLADRLTARYERPGAKCC